MCSSVLLLPLQTLAAFTILFIVLIDRKRVHDVDVGRYEIVDSESIYSLLVLVLLVLILRLLGLLVLFLLYLQVLLYQFYQLFFREVLVLLLIGGLFLLLLLLGLLELLEVFLTLGLALSFHFVDGYILWLFKFLDVLWFFEWGFYEFLPEYFSGKRWARIAFFLHKFMIASYFFELLDSCLLEFAIFYFLLLFFIDLVLPGHSLLFLFFFLTFKYSYFLGVNEGL